MATDMVEVRHNPTARRFEAEVEGGLAMVVYQRRGDQIIYTHTEVPPEAEGQGVGGALARTALDFARDEGLAVVPLCPFVSSYIRRHPEYQALVAG